MNYTASILLIYLVLATVSCSESQEINNTSGNNFDLAWSIPKEEVRDGGVGRDGIPALENPVMISAAQASYLTDNSLVVGVKSGDDTRAYPHTILDWHEIVNDKVGLAEMAVIYCPLTGTATGWNRKINGGVTTFGVSGLLYNSNIIPYDRLTNSNWSQIRLDCVNGSLKGERAETWQVVETTWKTWKTMFPDTKVLSDQTQYSRNYGNYPYGDYRTNNSKFIFPFSPEDARIPNKERVLGVVAPNKEFWAKVYRFRSFKNAIVVIEDNFSGMDLVVIGSEQHNFLVAFERRTENGDLISFTGAGFTADLSANMMQDNEGNTWNIFGEAVSGARKGQKLRKVTSFIGYWFSWGAFYPTAEIYEE